MTYVEEDQTGLPVYITTILTHDRDSVANAGVAYTMVDGDRSLFSVDSSTGVVTLQRRLDRETQDQYTVVIRATDTGEYYIHNLYSRVSFLPGMGFVGHNLLSK